MQGYSKSIYRKMGIHRKDELIEELWGEEYLDGAISIAVYVRKIREKIEENPAKPAYLKTVWGVGYSFEA